MDRVFYKYASAKGVIGILQSNAIYWTRPDWFNDPFDCNADLLRNVHDVDVKKALMCKIEECVHGPDEPDFRADAELAPLLSDLRASKALTRVDLRDRFIPIIDSTFADLGSAVAHVQAGFDSIRKSMRVLCVCEQKDVPLMWAHYADSHRGAVLELTAYARSSSALKVAKPIGYQDHPFELFGSQEWADFLVGVESPNFGKRVSASFFVKHTDWKYEKEWRCVWAAEIPPQQDIDGKLPVGLRDELTAVYLGARMSQSDVDQIIQLAKTFTPPPAIHQAELSTGRITFRRVV